MSNLENRQLESTLMTVNIDVYSDKENCKQITTVCKRDVCVSTICTVCLPSLGEYSPAKRCLYETHISRRCSVRVLKKICSIPTGS